MSKKDRLKEQSLKQLEAIKAAEREEAQSRKNTGESSAARKMRRRSSRFDSALTTVIKILMFIPFLWSGLYYGGIFILGISMDQMEDVPGRIAVFIAVGSALCLAGIILALKSRYLLQAAFIGVGTIFFMSGATHIVNKARSRIGDGIGLTEEQKGLASRWMLGLYPMLALTALSAALLAIWLLKRYKAAKRLRNERDNAPVKSIVE